MAIIAVMDHYDMAKNMGVMGVSSKFSKNADQQRKPICHRNKGHFSCIFALF
jgi:hypothetical protein